MKVYMFHYVKPCSNYYHYDLSLFEATIKYLKSKYKIISLKDYDNLLKNKENISDEYVMLTFDDGTKDHFEYVYPILKKYKCSGLFFIPSCISTGKMLDIQIIHQLISKVGIDILYNDLMMVLKEKEIKLHDYKIDDSLDNGKMAMFKQLLQYKLSPMIRRDILYYFSKKYNLSTDVYLNYITIDEMKKMKKNNIFFGIHTNTHPRLSTLPQKEQFNEINGNMKFLIDNNLIDSDLLSIAFPYGSFDKNTLCVMEKLNIKYGFKVNDAKSGEIIKTIKLIDRLDCNLLKEEVYEQAYSNR